MLVDQRPAIQAVEYHLDILTDQMSDILSITQTWPYATRSPRVTSVIMLYIMHVIMMGVPFRLANNILAYLAITGSLAVNKLPAQ